MNRIIKSLALTCLLAAGPLQMAAQELLEAYEESFNGAKFEQLWKSDEVLETPSLGMQGFGANDKIIVHVNIEGKLKYHDRNGWTGEEVVTQPRSGKGISYDDAGNWIFRPMNQQNKLQRTKPELILLSADGTRRSEIYFPESILPDSHIMTGNAYSYMGTAVGDVFSEEGGQFVFTAAKENTTDGLYVLRFRNGQLVEDESFRAGFVKVAGGSEIDQMVFTTEVYIHTWHASDGQLHYLYISRHENPIDMVLDEENHLFKGTIIDVENNMPEGYRRGQSNGYSMFSMGGRDYMVLPSLPNWEDAFHVIQVNLEDGSFVHKAYHSNVYPKLPGQQQYEYEFISSNWLNGEVINDSTAYIYQYFPWGYMAKYKFVDPIQETTLAYIANEGQEENTYTIADDIIAVYIAEKEPNRLYAKDLGKHRYPSVKGEGETDYVKDRAGLQTKDWDQSNWVLLDFATEAEARQFLTSSKGVIRGGTLTGVLTNKLNPTMTVTSYSVPDQWTGYDENQHVTANYMDPLVQTGNSGGKYFFVEPKAQEYVMINWATYDGHDSYHFRVPDNQQNSNLDQLAGGFKVDWSLYPGNYLEDFIQDHTYNFHAIIRYTADHHGVLGGGDFPSGAPLRDGEGVREGDYMVYPLEGGDDSMTAIDELRSDVKPVDVTYVNVMGMTSATPFDGVNIVLTRYSNGKVEASKVVY
jgi:hypothetical protein